MSPGSPGPNRAQEPRPAREPTTGAVTATHRSSAHEPPITTTSDTLVDSKAGSALDGPQATPRARAIAPTICRARIYPH